MVYEIDEEQNAMAPYRLHTLKDYLVKIQNKDISDLSFEKIYRTVYEIVRSRGFHNLYVTVEELIRNHIQNMRPNIHESLQQNHLDYLVKQWNDFLWTSEMFGNVLMFLNQTCLGKTNLQTTYNLSLDIFRVEIINHTEIQKCIQNILHEVVFNERYGKKSDHSIFKSTINMLLTLSKIDHDKCKIEYERIFEKDFIINSENFYRSKSQDFLVTTNDATTYIGMYKSFSHEEIERAKKLLLECTVKSVENILEKCFIEDQLDKIIQLQYGLRHMLEVKALTELNMFYNWYNKYSKQDEFLEFISRVFLEYGSSLIDRGHIADAEQSNVFKNVIKLRDDYDLLLKSCFQNDEIIKNRLLDNFKLLLGKNSCMSEYLTAYIHEILRKDVQLLTEEDLDKQLNIFIELFKLTPDEDTFEKFYYIRLAKRLLSNPNMEVEQKMISKLKQMVCPNAFTSKLQKMFNDVSIANTQMESFKEHIEANNISSLQNLDFTVKTLTSSYWPTLQIAHCCLPSTPKLAFDTFTQFYLTQHQKRKLTLVPQLGTAQISAEFYGNKVKKDEKIQIAKKYILHVTTYQMIILMLFNNCSKLKFSYIKDETNIPEKQLIKALQALSMGKTSQRILVTNAKSKDIDSNDEFWVNDGFESKVYRVKVKAVIDRLEFEEEKRKAHSQVQEDRKYEIQAIIVRVMKKEKKLDENNLISETISQLKKRVSPEPNAIKRQIKALIEKEYIRETEKNSKIYEYLA